MFSLVRIKFLLEVKINCVQFKLNSVVEFQVTYIREKDKENILYLFVKYLNNYLFVGKINTL